MPDIYLIIPPEGSVLCLNTCEQKGALIGNLCIAIFMLPG